MENTPSAYQDLTFSRLFTYYAGRGIELRERTFRKTLRFMTEDNSYNLLAQLLSDDSHIPIRFSIFSGTTKTAPLYTVREFGNTCLLVSLDKVLEFGEVLNVPILNDSPVNFELEVMDFISKGDGEIMLCKIRNVLQDESLSSDETVAEKLARIAPISTTAKTYLGYDGRDMGAWGEPMKEVKR